MHAVLLERSDTRGRVQAELVEHRREVMKVHEEHLRMRGRTRHHRRRRRKGVLNRQTVQVISIEHKRHIRVLKTHAQIPQREHLLRIVLGNPGQFRQQPVPLEEYIQHLPRDQDRGVRLLAADDDPAELLHVLRYRVDDLGHAVEEWARGRLGDGAVLALREGGGGGVAEALEVLAHVGFVVRDYV